MSQQVKILNRNSKYDKTIVDPHGMIVVHEPIPVVMGLRGVCIGKATGIEAEAYGTYAAIELSESVYCMSPTVTVAPMEIEVGNGFEIITRCELIRVALVPPDQTDTDPIYS